MRGDIHPLEFMARREDWQEGISLYARQVTEGIEQCIAKPLVLEPVDPTFLTEPFVRIGIQSAQNLMDELWQCGLRPTEGTGSAGSLRATEKHLDDMRKIAFESIGIKA